MRPRAQLILTAAALSCVASCSQRAADGTSAPLAGDAEPHPSMSPETECASCHVKHVEQWRTSSHAYAMHDPVFQAMLRVGQRDTKGELGDFCVKCHSPLGVLTGQLEVVVDPKSGDHVQPFEGLREDAMSGVSCLVCHSMTKVTGTSNAEFELSLDGIRRGPIMDSAPSPVHESEFSGLFLDTEICGTCHVVVSPKKVALERTHIEWVQSAFNGAKSCQDCHMPKSKGPAARGYPDRTVHDHTFVGVDVSLLPEDEFPGFAALRGQVEQLLRESVKFSATADMAARRLNVRIDNLAGHALPSGATADREMWVEVIVRDDASKVVFESGTPDERGDLRVPFAERTTRPGTDPSLALYTQEMYYDPKLDDPSATEPRRLVDFLWEPNTDVTHLIGVSSRGEPSYDLAALPGGHYVASVRLLFRSFPPHVLRKLEKIGGLDPAVKGRVPTVEMASTTVDLSLP